MASILKVNTIQDATNSNTAISVDSSGRVTLPQQVAFTASITNASGSSGHQGPLVFDLVSINKGSHYDNSNGRFTAPVAGIYFFSFHGFVCGNSSAAKLGSGSTFGARFQVDGGNFTGMQRIYHIIDASNYAHVSFSQIIELSASQYVTVNVTDSYIYGVAGATDIYNGFGGHLIG